MDRLVETFVDAFGEISLKHGMIRIDLVSLSGSEPVVTQRLITSLQAFSQMLQAQNGMLEQLEKAGLIRPAQPAPDGEPAPERGGVVTAMRRLGRIEPAASPAIPPAPLATAPSPADATAPKSPNFSDIDAGP